MKIYNSILKTLVYTFFLLGIINLSYARTPEYNYNAKNISNYFSAIVSFNNFDYEKSEKFLNKLDGIEENNKIYSKKLLHSLINLEKFNKAYLYSQTLERKNFSIFESNLISGSFEIKNKNYSKALYYFSKISPNFENHMAFDILKVSLTSWAKIGISNDTKDIKIIESIPPQHKNLKLIQLAFAHCHFKTPDTKKMFQNIINEKSANFSRYNFFYAKYLFLTNNLSEAEKVTNFAADKYPRNLLINQFKKTLEKQEVNKNKFNCNNIEDIIAEIFYVIANALSVQGAYKLSNFYINLAKYLNPNFSSYQSLLAENFVQLNKFEEAKKIYKDLSKTGSIYKWYATKQIAALNEEEGKKKEALSLIENTFKKIKPGIYETFDLANFLRNQKKYDESIKLYSDILLVINEDHELYPKVLDRRGTAYERTNKWELSKKDLLLSLKIEPKAPYVMNYLAYSWVEKGENIEEALKMLKEANDLKQNDGYITDSLGWALFKLNNFSESKKYLELAIKLMPNDPIINDHFADCLWMNDLRIQARYYWKYVLNLEKTEEDLKRKVENKLLFGIENK